ncbi:hypothetical protein IMCC3317_12700 [Kordia antarctica]|uniref:Zinc-ribbon 15 domain-containing protein n=1 Tax=Kordia antarctica TaxID=1218801 RepID=A0A7L4ZGZ9_9FLAO|nr:zinc-ribbon domain-containing protein [Kordia antarctica]QHI35922.1 hypothetical protein IMCC3317_12700 [Kordia antarctica]
MIIYGTNSKNLGSRKLQGVKCPNCEATEIHAQAVSSYVTVFWIPIFPYRKKYSTVCKNCTQVLKKKEMPQSLKDKLAMEKGHFKTPFYLFSGLIILALLITLAFYLSGQHDKRLAENVGNLQSKDIVVFKVAHKEYSFAEIETHSNDTIYMRYGNYTYDGYKPSESKVEKLKASETDFFSTEIDFFTQKQLDSLYAKGEIAEIYKKK